MYPYSLDRGFIRVDTEKTTTIDDAATDELWETVKLATVEYGLSKVLITGNASSRTLTVLDIYESGERPAKEKIPNLKVAFCLQNYTPDDLTQFFMTVAINRGARIAFFKNEEEAIAWLN
ncbi:MAG: hypothetical protein C9356_10215 [Oleiphilus sp.]|nr:MAG: hypothetical protein C9356_10215 [Oleiphilus sp.]